MANGFKFRIRGIENASAQMRAAIDHGIDNALDKVGLLGESYLHQTAPVGATGFLANSANHLVEGRKVQIFIGPPADVYAPPVDLGARPHMPPVNALIPWVMKKFNPANEEDAKSIAWAIAKSIAKRGTKAQHFADKAFDMLQPMVKPIFEKEIAAALTAAGFGGGHAA